MARFVDMRPAGNDEEITTLSVHANEAGNVVLSIYPDEGDPEVYVELSLREAKALSEAITGVIREEIKDIQGG